MMLCKKAETPEEIAVVIKACKELAPSINNMIEVYGYWKDGEFIGASYLDAEYPNHLNMEYHDKSGGIVAVIAESFKELFKYKKVLTAKISPTHGKSLKMVDQLGFKKIYSANGFIYFEISADTWAFKDKYPVV